MFKCFKVPEQVVSPDAFAAKVENKNSELLNGKRMYLGFSELAGALSNMNQVIRDGGEREIYHASLVDKWDKLCRKSSLVETLLELNTYDMPGRLRNPTSMTEAVDNILKLSTAIRQDWQFWSEVFCRTGYASMILSFKYNM